MFSGDQVYGEPYCYALPFVARDENVIEFTGLVKPIERCQWRAIREACKAAGIKVVRTRIRNGEPHTARLRTIDEGDTQ